MSILDGCITDIQAQVRLLVLAVRPVAVKSLVRKDWTNVPVELQLPSSRGKISTSQHGQRKKVDEAQMHHLPERIRAVPYSGKLVSDRENNPSSPPFLLCKRPPRPVSACGVFIRHESLLLFVT